MRLILLFEKVNLNKLKKELRTQDIILTCDKEIYDILIKEINNKVYFENLFENASENHNEFNDNFLSFFNKVDVSLNGNLYPIVLPFVNGISKKTINYIDEVINCINKYSITNNIEKLVLFGGSPKVNYTSIYFAEGEVPVKLLYKRSWFLNFYINKLLLSTFEIKWVNKESRLKLNLFKLIRRAGTKYLRIALIAKKIMVTNKNKINSLEIINEINSKKNNVSLLLVRNPVQIKPLENIFSEINSKKSSEAIFITSSMLQKNSEFNLNKNHKQVNVDSIISLKELLNILRKSQKIYRSIKKISKDKRIFDIELNEVTKEIGSAFIEFLYRVYTLEKINNEIENVSYIFSTETYNHNAAAEGLFGKVNNIPTYTIQHVTYPKEIFYRNNWTNGLICMTKDIYDYFRISDPKNTYYYFGPLAYDNVFNKSLSTEKYNNTTVVIYTQPDEFTQKYINIIKNMHGVLKDESVDIIIKLHPRERNIGIFEKVIDEGKNLKSNCRLFLSNKPTEELILKSHLSVSISSGTLFQSVLSGTPALSLPQEMKIEHIDFLNGDLIEKTDNIERLKYILHNYEGYLSDYNKRRKAYFTNELNYTGDATNIMLNNILK